MNFFNQKPGSLYIKLEMLEKILGDSFQSFWLWSIWMEMSILLIYSD